MRKWIALAVAAAMFAAPPAAAQAESTPTTLYFHVFDTFNKFPINTQPMDAEFFEVGGNSFPSYASQGYDFNTIYGYSTAGPVEYEFIENGRPRFHPERGIAQDVQIDTAVQPVVYLYVDVRDVVGVDSMPMFLPDFTFDITVRTGDEFGDVAKLDAGEEIMSASYTAHIIDTQTNPVAAVNALFVGDPVPNPIPGGVNVNDELSGHTAADGKPVLVPDETGIVEFVIPMTSVPMDTIPKSAAYNVRIDWYQGSDAFGPDEFSTGFFRLAADIDHLPRMELAVKNPIYVEYVHPQVAAGTLLIHTGVNSPWGTYDVDVDNMTLTITGPDGSVVKEHLGAADDGTAGKLERFVSQGAHVHDQHDKAAEITYMWKFREESAPNGQYTIDLTVPNLRGNAQDSAQAKFTIEGKKAFGESDSGEIVEPVEQDAKKKDSPAPLLFIPLAIAFLARRWRA